MKTCFITGATSGIGRACAERFAKEEYNLILNGRRGELLNELKAQLETQCGVAVTTLNFDVRDRAAVETALTTTLGFHDAQHFNHKEEGIDVLINNAGLALGLEKEHEGSLDDYETMIDTNIKGLLYITKAIVPDMVRRGKGHIINIGSVAGEAAYPNGSVYCATKAAVKALSDGLRIDLVDTPIRVTNIKPGLVETNFSVTRFHGDKARADKVYQGIRPLRGEDIADVVYYAASAPEHVQIAEVLVLAMHQANGSIIYRASK